MCRRSTKLFVTESDVIKFSQVNNSSVNNYRRIPRIIHQTWKNATIPDRWQRSVRSVRDLNTNDFEYRLWTDEDIHKFVQEKEPNFYATTFLSYSYDIQRIDAFRYVLLYHVGGIYIDMDNGCSKPFDILLNTVEGLDPVAQHLTALPETEPIALSNDFMISTKGHPLFAQLISRLTLFNHNYISHYLTVMLSTGPLYLAINEYLFSKSSEMVSVRIIDNKVYTRLFLWFAGGSSWHGWDAQIIGSTYQTFRHFSTRMLFSIFSVFILVITLLYLQYRY